MPIEQSPLLASLGVPHCFVGPTDALAPIANGFGVGIDPLFPQQVHGHRVVKDVNLKQLPADGLWSTAAAGIGIRTADCIPVLLAAPDGTVAAIHAGWRGVARGIVTRYLLRQKRQPIEDWAVAMGPSASNCCYEVGAEVSQAVGLDAKQQRIDLRDILSRQLEALGVRWIDRVGPCTICSRQGWSSWRREGEQAGRNRSVIWSVRGGE